jgi:hypothetical protein
MDVSGLRPADRRGVRRGIYVTAWSLLLFVVPGPFAWLLLMPGVCLLKAADAELSWRLLRLAVAGLVLSLPIGSRFVVGEAAVEAHKALYVFFHLVHVAMAVVLVALLMEFGRRVGEQSQAAVRFRPRPMLLVFAACMLLPLVPGLLGAGVESAAVAAVFFSCGLLAVWGVCLVARSFARLARAFPPTQEPAAARPEEATPGGGDVPGC